MVERQPMKLVTYLHDKHISCGVLTEKGVVDIPASFAGQQRPPRSLKEIFIRGTVCLNRIAAVADTSENFIELESVKLLAPIPRPGKILALAGNYVKHIKEAGREPNLSDSPRNTSVPRPFIMPATVITGPETEIPWPVYSEQIDYEIELAVVIGKAAKCVSPDEAVDCIAGYCIANDISARSVTFKENRQERPKDDFFDWLNGKWADGFLPMGPWLVTADSIGDVQSLEMELKVNGETRQKSNTSQMIYSAAEIVSFISHLMTLEPGDCIATGTPEGVAMASGKYLAPGDKIECTIEKLGTLTNIVGQKPNQFYKPLAE